MPDLVDFLPLFQEDASTVRGRMDADANAGLTVDDPRWIDTREGTFYWDITQIVLLEIVRLWDALAVEVPASAFPEFAWGEYLDYHAATFDLVRKPAVPAGGEVGFTGTDGTVIPAGTVVSAPAPTDTADPVEFETLADVTVAGGVATATVEALEDGIVGNVSAGAITEIESTVDGLSGVTNAAAMLGGEEIESDEELRIRIEAEYQGHGSGNINDYRRWALSRPGVGRAFVLPVASGPGTLLVVVMTADGSPVAPAVVTDVQDYIDPTPGSADGVAPPGITVTVETPTGVTIDVAATITFKPGYSLTGSAGDVAQQAEITAALRNYVNGLDVGDDVIYNHVLAQFFRAPGVLNVPALTVNGATSDVVITATPAQIARFGTATLT